MMDVAGSDDAVSTAARNWLLHFELEQSSVEDQLRFQAWRVADPRHDSAYRRFETIWQETRLLKDLESLAPLSTPADRGGAGDALQLPVRSRRTWATIGVALAASVVFAVVVFRLDLLLRLTAPSSGLYSTGTGELRNLRLADGSTLVLGAHSALEVAFRQDERHVSLTSGEAYFSVVKDMRRPFVVEVGDKQVRVLGTAFEVRRQGQALRVAVAEGAVEITQRPKSSLAAAVETSSEKRVLLHAGEELSAGTSGVIQAPEPMPQEEPASWRHGRRVYVNAPLSEVVADANRYSRQTITIDNPSIADLSVSVTYPSDQVNEMLSALSSSLPIELERSGANIRIKAKVAKASPQLP